MLALPLPKAKFGTVTPLAAGTPLSAWETAWATASVLPVPKANTLPAIAGGLSASGGSKWVFLAAGCAWRLTVVGVVMLLVPSAAGPGPKEWTAKLKGGVAALVGSWACGWGRSHDGVSTAALRPVTAAWGAAGASAEKGESNRTLSNDLFPNKDLGPIYPYLFIHLI